MPGFTRSAPVLRALALALSVSACASAPPVASGRGEAPWAALTSPTAALKVAFDEVCVASVMEGRSLEQLALQHYLVAVSPRSTGSPTATAAWRLASYSSVYVVALPTGGCSVSVEGGDPDGLNAAAVEMLRARAAFAPLAAGMSPDGKAERTAWCTPEADRPWFASLMRRTSGRRNAFVANVTRAQGARPSFCPAV
jgi:hypothetical protein